MPRSNGTRKSTFPTQTSVPAGSYFDYVFSGANYRISFSDFVTSLGVSGTIQREGLASDAAVLDDQGAVKGIRNINAGFGIATSIDPNNSLSIATDFSFDNVGVEIVEDASASAPNFRSVTAGSGIAVSGSGGQLQISATGIPASTKTIAVSQLSDLPTPVSNVITLASDTNYQFIDDVDLGINRLVLNGNMISAVDASIIKITYTGTDTMFTSTGTTTNKIEGLKLACPNGQMFDISGGGVGIFQLLNMNIESADTLGVWNNLAGSQISNIFMESYTTNGLLFTGAHGVFVSDATLINVNAGVMYDLGTATFDGFTLTNSFPNVSAGATFLSGLTGSGNVNAGGLATMVNITQTGLGDVLVGPTPDDVRWQFALNNTINDTFTDSLSYNTAGVTVPITTINTPVLIGGTWIDDNSSQFTVDGAGTVTYIGNKVFHTPITAALTTHPVSGSNKDYTCYIAINGVAVQESGRKVRASSTDRQSVTPIWQHQFENGDTVSVMIENNSDTTDFVVEHAVLRLN